MKKGIDIDKNIPKKYQVKHREFKRLAWKIKMVLGVQTQVVFDEYKLILRYKKKDEGVNKYNFNIEKEWFPKPGEVTSLAGSNNSGDPSKLASPAIDTSILAQCHKTAIVTGIPDSINSTNVHSELLKHFAESDHVHIRDLEFKAKGTSLVVCKDWTSCKNITEKYNKTKFLDTELTFTLFSEKNPSADFL